MKVVAKTMLVTDRKKPAAKPGTVVDLPKAEAQRLLDRKLVLPYEPDGEVQGGTGTGDAQTGQTGE